MLYLYPETRGVQACVIRFLLCFSDPSFMTFDMIVLVSYYKGVAGKHADQRKFSVTSFIVSPTRSGSLNNDCEYVSWWNTIHIYQSLFLHMLILFLYFRIFIFPLICILYLHHDKKDVHGDEKVIRAFGGRWAANFSCPSTIATDRGHMFESALFRRLTVLLGTNYHPQANVW